jgi:flagellar biosynthesis/type III secretory pathway protein FliH
MWIKRLLRRKVKSPNIKEIEHINDLLEADTMLAERIESWFDEATQKGLQKGLQQGRLEGQANILSKLLKLRFGDLPPEAVERLSRATQEELDAWSEAVLSAPSLAAVFETHRH